MFEVRPRRGGGTAEAEARRGAVSGTLVHEAAVRSRPRGVGVGVGVPETPALRRLPHAQTTRPVEVDRHDGLAVPQLSTPRRRGRNLH